MFIFHMPICGFFSCPMTTATAATITSTPATAVERVMRRSLHECGALLTLGTQRYRVYPVCCGSDDRRSWLRSFVPPPGSVRAVKYGSQRPGGQSGPQTDWDSYKNRSFTPSVDQHLTDPALIGAIDLHAHCDPDSYPRQADAFDVVASREGSRSTRRRAQEPLHGNCGARVPRQEVRHAGYRGVWRPHARHAGRWDESTGGPLHGRRCRALRPDRLDADPRFGTRGHV